eukprot:Phypoly_transcript_10818.p1 GENE.Phypoly_transcript_10818~~Phypoly_transcript_10818.p1  ORF type:complete len:276 (+),score=47.92 Phypoly_transcript_10818:435-1262(+)
MTTLPVTDPASEVLKAEVQKIIGRVDKVFQNALRDDLYKVVYFMEASPNKPAYGYQPMHLKEFFINTPLPQIHDLGVRDAKNLDEIVRVHFEVPLRTAVPLGGHGTPNTEEQTHDQEHHVHIQEEQNEIQEDEDKEEEEESGEGEGEGEGEDEDEDKKEGEVDNKKKGGKHKHRRNRVRKPKTKTNTKTKMKMKILFTELFTIASYFFLIVVIGYLISQTTSTKRVVLCLLLGYYIIILVNSFLKIKNNNRPFWKTPLAVSPIVAFMAILVQFLS